MNSYSKFNAAAQAETHFDSAVEAPQSQPITTAPLPPEHHQHRKKKSTPGVIEQKSLWNTEIIRQAIFDSFRKLNPRVMAKNPVMFVVEVGSVLTSLLLIDNIIHHRVAFGFNLQITLWLWFTVLFANFAEAMAEARGKAQADTLRKAKRRNHRSALHRFGRSRAGRQWHASRRRRHLYPCRSLHRR